MTDYSSFPPWSPNLALSRPHRRFDLGASRWLRYRRISTRASEHEWDLQRGSFIEQSSMAMWNCHVFSICGVVRTPHLELYRPTFSGGTLGPAHSRGDRTETRNANETSK